jgi:hypothetical protein
VFVRADVPLQPKVLTEENWRLGVFIDEHATDEQFDNLVQVFSGQLGGPIVPFGIEDRSLDVRLRLGSVTT